MWILKIRAKILLLTERIAGARFGARGVPVAASRARVGVEISAGAAGGRPEGHCGASPGLVLKGEHQKLARQVERRGADWRTADPAIGECSLCDGLLWSADQAH